MSDSEKSDLWRRWKGGESLSAIRRALEKNPGSVHDVLQLRGGIAPRPRRRASRALTMAQREEISRGVAMGRTFRAMAIDIRRAPSTVGREVSRNKGRTSYRAKRAEKRAGETARRPKECVIATRPKLCRVVAKQQKKRASSADIRLAPSAIRTRCIDARVARDPFSQPLHSGPRSA